MIYLDNAATTFRKPRSVMNAVNTAMLELSANPGRGGHAPSVRAARAVYKARKNIARFFNMEKEENVIFTENCTAALNIVIKGALKKGDHVVISSMEHNSVLRPVEKLSRSGFISYSAAEVKDNDDETVDSFRKALNSRTKLIVCTHASNVFGTVLPVGRLCALAHLYGIMFCLDAAQSAGALEIDMTDGYDYVCCAGHKGLYGPMGTGLLLINNGYALDTLKEGGTGSESDDPSMPDYLPDRLESGTLNVPGIAGLSAGVDFVRAKTAAKIYSHELALIRELYNELSSISGVRLFTDMPIEGRYAPVLSFAVDGADSETVAAFLNDRYGIAARAGLHCAPLAHRTMGTEASGTVRISPSVFTTRAEIQTAAAAVKRFAQSVNR